MADINLTASMRSNLLSLQNTQGLMDMTSERLSTGKKVNSAIDNPSSYYTASSLDNRATDLTSLLDSMGQGISTLTAVDNAIESITGFVEQADAILSSAMELNPDTEETPASTVALEGSFPSSPGKSGSDIYTVSVDGGTPRSITVDYADNYGLEDYCSALETALNTEFGLGTFTVSDTGEISMQNTSSTSVYTFDSLSGTSGVAFPTPVSPAATLTVNNLIPEVTDRADAYERFADILVQIDSMAADSSYKGINLLNGDEGAALTVYFNEDRSSKLIVDGVDIRSSGLGLTSITAEDFVTNLDLEIAMATVDGAIDSLRNHASDFGNYYSILESREEFTNNLINVLTSGSDKLTLADMNEESANMLALQTRQELATNSLSLSSQAAQSVLNLF